LGICGKSLLWGGDNRLNLELGDKILEISVIVPIYNVEKHLDRCIGSVLAQTFLDWELLLVNDGSTDGSENICYQYVTMDKRIHYLKQVHAGQGIARNYGVQEARGKYIFFLDADDWIRTDTLWKLYDQAERKELDMLIFDYVIIERDKRGELVERIVKLPIQLSEVTDCRETPALFYRLEGSIWNKFYQRKLILPIQQAGHPYEDSAILPVIISHAKRVGQLREPFYYYWGIRGGSTVNKGETVYYLKDAMQEIYQYFTRYTERDWKMKYEEPLRKYNEYLLLVAKNHVARKDCYEDEKTRLYDNIFLKKCEDFIIKSYSKERKARNLCLAVWGSYNLRCIINRFRRNLCLPEYHFSFSNIVSLMADRNMDIIDRKVNKLKHKNTFRNCMLHMDIEQTFRHLSLEEYKKIDFLCIDLMEERFLPIMYEQELLTGSDAFFETNVLGWQSIVDLDHDLEKYKTYWKKSAKYFADFLKTNFSESRIILVENYLCEGFGVYQLETKFKEITSIKKQNNFLQFCYSYMEKQLPDCHIIRMEKQELLFTDSAYPHGCYPQHQNEYLYYEVADKIEDIILS